MIDKISKGKINKFISDNTLLNQVWIMDPKSKVSDILKENKIDTIIDDTEENFSSKMKKFDLIGVPYQILLGKKSDDEMLEFKKIGEESTKLEIDEIIKIINLEKKH